LCAHIHSAEHSILLLGLLLLATHAHTAEHIVLLLGWLLRWLLLLVDEAEAT